MLLIQQELGNFKERRQSLINDELERSYQSKDRDIVDPNVVSETISQSNEEEATITAGIQNLKLIDDYENAVEEKKKLREE